MQPRSPGLAAAAVVVAACSGAQRADPVTIHVDREPNAEVVVAEARSAAPAADAPPKEERAAAVARALVELDEPPLAAIGSLSTGRPAPATTAQPGPKATVSIGGVSLSGGAIPNASAVAAGMVSGMRRCVQRELAANPNGVPASKVTLTAQIGPNGEVLSVTPAGGSGLPKALIACLLVRVTISQFVPPDTGSATMTLPVAIHVH